MAGAVVVTIQSWLRHISDMLSLGKKLRGLRPFMTPSKSSRFCEAPAYAILLGQFNV